MAKTAKYTVQLAKNFQQPTRWRNGLQFQRNVPQVLELTAEEVKVFEDDRYMEIKKGAPKGKSENASSSKSDALPSADPTTAPVVDPAQTPENGSDDTQTGNTDEEEATGGEDETPEAGEDRKVKLLQKSRNAINTIAKQAGVENAKELPNKEAVVSAIIEAETANQGE